MEKTTGQYAIARAEWMGRAERIAEQALYVAKGGKKFDKIIRDGSVFCFIEIATGNVLKAATYNAPAKGKRGSIYEVGQEGVDKYGALYLK